MGKVTVIHDGHPDRYYPSRGLGHLARYADGPRIGRITRVFHAAPLTVGVTVSFDTLRGLKFAKAEGL